MKRLLTTALAFFLSTASWAAPPATTDARIRLVQNLVPPVLVKGEAPAIQALAQRMAELHVPGVSIAVIHEGRIDWARGFGVTRIGGPPVTDGTLFQAASISKPVFALGVLHLVETGKLDLDADVNGYLRSWKLPENELTRNSKVTLRRLLSHSAGLTVHGFGGYAADARIPDTVQILDGAPPANSDAVRVDIAPGSRFRYSGGGYVLAQRVLTDVTGTALPKLLHDLVLAPLGMTRSTFEQPLPPSRMAEVAMPYRGDGSAIAEGPHVYPEVAAAGLWTTPTDLARYALGVQAALAGKARDVISSGTARDMLTPVIEQQGLGIHVGGQSARKFFQHGGANEGYRCMLVAYEDGEGAVVMTNSDSGDQLLDAVVRTIAHVYQWPDFAPPTRTLAKLAPDALRKFSGVYQLNDGQFYVVRMDGDRLVGNVIGNTPVALFPASATQLFARDVNVIADFVVGADGRAASLHHSFNGWKRDGQRLDDARARPIIASVEADAQRFKDQKPAPGSDAALRQLFADIAAGTPAYETMTPQFAELTRQNLARLQPMVAQWGALKKLTFKSVGDNGADEYDADFENGAFTIYLGLDAGGQITGVNFVPR